MFDRRKKVKLVDALDIWIQYVVNGMSGFGGFLNPKTDAETRAACLLMAEFFRPNPSLGHGLRCMDSATMYGGLLSNERVGTEIRFQQDNIAPEEVVVMNKYGWLRVPRTGRLADVPGDYFEHPCWPAMRYASHTIQFAQTREQMYQSILQGKQALGPGVSAPFAAIHDAHKVAGFANDTTEVNGVPLNELCFMGGRLREDSFVVITDEYVPAFIQARNEGLIRAIGLGQQDHVLANRIIEATDDVIQYVMLANAPSIFRHGSDLLDMLESWKDRKIGVIQAAPLHAGWAVRRGVKKIDGTTDPTDEEAAWKERFLTACEEFSFSPAAVCIQFLASIPTVSCVAVGNSRVDHLYTNFPRNPDGSDVQVPFTLRKRLVDDGVIDQDFRYMDRWLSDE